MFLYQLKSVPGLQQWYGRWCGTSRPPRLPRHPAFPPTCTAIGPVIHAIVAAPADREFDHGALGMVRRVAHVWWEKALVVFIDRHAHVGPPQKRLRTWHRNLRNLMMTASQPKSCPFPSHTAIHHPSYRSCLLTCVSGVRLYRRTRSSIREEPGRRRTPCMPCDGRVAAGRGLGKAACPNALAPAAAPMTLYPSPMPPPCIAATNRPSCVPWARARCTTQSPRRRPHAPPGHHTA